MSDSSLRPRFWLNRVPYFLGIAFGAGFGLLFRLLAQYAKTDLGQDIFARDASWVMTAAFLMLGPFAMGYITMFTEQRIRPRGPLAWIFVPWIAVLLGLVLVSLLNLEGFICVVFAAPIALFFSSLGGVAAGIFTRRRSKRQNVPMACVAILPLLLAPMESLVTSPIQIRAVETEIRIHATNEAVWRNIERVKPIAPVELRRTWTHTIGFPRPVEATLSHEGVGGVRHASFEGGLMFIETITRWDTNRVLGFSIKADTAAIPRSTLDEHASIGGRYFDVLDGEYRLEPLPGGDILLHLKSKERLSTDFNGYAGLWTDAVMSSLQKSILEVVKRRCEAGL